MIYTQNHLVDPVERNFGLLLLDSTFFWFPLSIESQLVDKLMAFIYGQVFPSLCLAGVSWGTAGKLDEDRHPNQQT